MIDETIYSFAKKIVEITKANHGGMQQTMKKHISEWYKNGIIIDTGYYPVEEI